MTLLSFLRIKTTQRHELDDPKTTLTHTNMGCQMRKFIKHLINKNKHFADNILNKQTSDINSSNKYSI
jgi:hypothetical protein